MNSEIKIIFVDIDWTLLNHNIHDFDYESIDALNRLHDKGIKVFISTSRPYDSMVDTNILKYLKVDGTITTNGAVVFAGETILRNHYFDPKIVAETLKICAKHHLVVEYSSEKERHFSIKPNVYVEKFFESYAETDPGVKKYEGEKVSAMLLLAPKKYDEVLKKELSDLITYLRFDTYCVDLQIERTFKSDGVEIVLNHYGISKDNALSIGDDVADVYMFNVTGHSMALGNAKDEIKASAEYVTYDIDHHGVKEGLKHFGL